MLPRDEWSRLPLHFLNSSSARHYQLVRGMLTPACYTPFNHASLHLNGLSRRWMNSGPVAEGRSPNFQYRCRHQNHIDLIAYAVQTIQLDSNRVCPYKLDSHAFLRQEPFPNVPTLTSVCCHYDLPYPVASQLQIRSLMIICH